MLNLNMPKLDKEEEAKALEVANTIMGKSCLFAAKVLKCGSVAVKTSGDFSAKALRKTADGIEKSSNFVSSKLDSSAEKYEKKGHEYMTGASELSNAEEVKCDVEDVTEGEFRLEKVVI